MIPVSGKIFPAPTVTHERHHTTVPFVHVPPTGSLAACPPPAMVVLLAPPKVIAWTVVPSSHEALTVIGSVCVPPSPM